MQKLRLIKLKNVSIFEQLQLEEKLLRGSDENFCIYNVGSSPAVVMGISGKTEEHVEPPLPIPLIRRFSGGGTVVINEETHFITWILNHTASPAKPFPKALLHYCGEQIQEVVPGAEITDNDFTFQNRKFGGNAQYITKDRWLHHTSLLWDYSPEQMQFLKLPPKMPLYREKRSHSDFLLKLQEILESPELIPNRLQEALEKRFHLISTTLEELKIERTTRISTTEVRL